MNTGNHKPSDQIKQEDSLKTMVEAYYRLNIKVFQKNSTKEDIDAIFELFTDDFEYNHPKYGGLYTRDVLYRGYVNNQKNGGYDGSVKDVRVENMIIGLNCVAVSRRYITGNARGETEEGELQMTLFEFRDGKISRIMEYW
ncbi:nuclear transport factor 2 family protein [Leptobacterium flavescens]|uniref:Nuclear transport factor 2 family protein n=2 Tax=Leptobacterium flavescens TaxID=472055 RepID=A0A6P0UQI9_9FLAO|nr:nuclear transport factor 2 family protein [Leptobacterium flavescens]